MTQAEIDDLNKKNAGKEKIMSLDIKRFVSDFFLQETNYRMWKNDLELKLEMKIIPDEKSAVGDKKAAKKF